MSSAESLEAQPAAARAAVARVLGIDPATLREDTPLPAIGWDSLARLCWTDAVGEAGWRVDALCAARATNLAELGQSLSADGSAR
jgi:hypothetical protein